MTFSLTRRSALFAGAALPLAAALGAGPARAAADIKGPSTPDHYRFKIGAFDVTALKAGSRALENPQETYGLNVTPEDFAEASQQAFIPADRGQNFFTPSVVNTGNELVLFDAGLSADGTLAALTAAGYSSDQVDVVVLTHMHGDHINGLMSGDAPTYPNARYVAGAVENDYWAGAGNDGYDKTVRPLLDKTTLIHDGDSVVSGITGMAAFGHSPGHMVYHVQSNGQRLVLTADLANHPVWSLARPDWEVRFDMDKAMAAEARRKVLGMLAAERVPMLAYHFAFPPVGYVEARGEGFHFVPMSYQLLLDPPAA